MIQPKIQEVWISINPENELPKENDYYNVKYDYTNSIKTLFFKDNEFSGATAPIKYWLNPEKLITFTPEEFETFKREFGKELLELAADKAKAAWVSTWNCEPRGIQPQVDKESITSTLDDYLLNNKI
jgi:hypothetical protein